jgi:hypothetical protein
VFLKFGRVWEVYIPKKLDKRGRRFGFVKFKEVKEVEALNASMQDVWIGSYKLVVNQSRFNRSEQKEAQSSKPSKALGLYPMAAVVGDKPGRPYRSALLGASSSGTVLGNQMEIKAVVNELLKKELKGSVIGTLAREKDVRRIQTILLMEGFNAISVTHMGSNMALLRSPVEGDVERLIRSNNECLKYFFSELRPWVPGIVSTHREIWVQVFGIPISIWGEEFFKQVGEKLGKFLDYDEATASMRRLDVARIRVQSDIWSDIDVIIKVEVEGVKYNVRVMEERVREPLEKVMGEEVDDEESRVVPSEGYDAEEEVFGEDGGNSGDDEDSEPEYDGDATVQVQIGEYHEAGRYDPMREEGTLERNDPLPRGKSTKIPYSNKGSESPDHGIGGSKVQVASLDVVSPNLVGPSTGKECDDCMECGPQSAEGVHGVVQTDTGCKLLGQLGHYSDPIQEALSDVGSVERTRAFSGPDEFEQVSRFSSISEPEEVNRPRRAAKQKKSSRLSRHKSSSKPQQIGVPKCLILLEAVKEGNNRVRRRRTNSGDATLAVPVVNSIAPIPGATPPSGLNLITSSDASMVMETPAHNDEEDRVKVLEAAKLISIQKQVGFSFEAEDGETVKQLIVQENCDRAKKMEWEQRNGDQ